MLGPLSIVPRTPPPKRGNRWRLQFEVLEPRTLLHAGLHFQNGVEVSHGNLGHTHPLLPAHMDPIAADSGRNFAPLAPSAAPASSPVDTANTFKLHSNPTANHTIFLDFDGHVTTGTTWNQATGRATITTAAYDPSGDGSAFNTTELDRIQKIWQRVAGDFSMFNVDVTTEDPGAAALSKSGTGDTKWGVRAVITPTDWDNCGCGGFAYVGSFNDSVDEPVFIFNTGEVSTAAAISHEVGHSLYLAHDGLTTGSEYYNGHGTGETSWGPIMGSGYYSNVTTWDNGAYYNANNKGTGANYGYGADDFAVIAGSNGFSYRPDEHADTRTAASDVTILGTNATNVSLNDVGSFGIIGRSIDLDFFKFTTGAGAINLTIDSYYSRIYVKNSDGTFSTSYQPTSTSTTGQGSNLDVLATLYDANGNVIATSNPTGLSATFTNTLAAGTYYISVDGTGYGNWAASTPSGYDQFVSQGQYYLRGTIVKTTQTNQLPVANTDSAATSRDQSVQVNVLANDTDPNGDSLTITAKTDPAHGSVVINGGTSITYTPAAYYFGPDSFTYTISDGRGGTATGTVNVNVTTPTTINLNKTAFEIGESISVAFAGGPGNATDWIGIYASGNVPGSVTSSAWYYTNGTRTSGGSATSGSVVIDSGAATSTWPLPAGNYFAAFFLNDGYTELAARVSFTVLTPNVAPDAVNDSPSTNEDTAVNFTVLANDTDPNGDALSVTAVTPATNGTVSINANNTVRYTPAGNYFGSDSFTYTISDGRGGSDTATVTVNVTSVNDVPLAATDSATTNEDTAVTLDVLANDNDIDGGTLVVASTANGGKGTTSVGSDNRITYTPNANVNGSDSFTYVVRDGQGGQTTGTVSLTITPQNDVPTANNDQAMTTLTAPVTITVLANDLDVDGNTLTPSLVTLATNGTAVVNANGSITYTANANFTGSDSFTYKVNDGAVDSAPATVSITVNANAKFFVVDSNATDRTFRYRDDMVSLGSNNLSTANSSPTGVAASPDGSRLWVLDSSRTIYVYDVSAAGLTQVGAWSSSTLRTPTGIAVAGSNLWVVDSNTDRAYFYSGGANRLNGSAAATRSFALRTGNTNPQDIASDGTYVWVVNSASPDRVFVYQASNGAHLGNWIISSANTSPVGITLDPTTSNSTKLWIVDDGADKVFEYASGRTLRNATTAQAASASYALASGNTSPVGIADPLVGFVAADEPAVADDVAPTISVPVAVSTALVRSDRVSPRRLPDAARFDRGTLAVSSARVALASSWRELARNASADHRQFASTLDDLFATDEVWLGE